MLWALQTKLIFYLNCFAVEAEISNLEKKSKSKTICMAGLEANIYMLYHIFYIWFSLSKNFYKDIMIILNQTFTHACKYVQLIFAAPPYMSQPWTPALPTSAWMNPGGTQTTTSTSRLVGPCVTATCLENGTASLAWRVMPCPLSVSLRITVAPTLPSGSTAATPSLTKASSPCLCAPASMTTAASGTPV